MDRQTQKRGGGDQGRASFIVGKGGGGSDPFSSNSFVKVPIISPLYFSRRSFVSAVPALFFAVGFVEDVKGGLYMRCFGGIGQCGKFWRISKATRSTLGG